MKKYHYKECGLDTVWLLNGFKEEVDEYGTSIHINNIDGLHKIIAQALVDSPEPLQGKAVRFLRTELDLSQNALGELLGVSDQTIANWEKNKLRKSKQTYDYLLRHIYKQNSNQNSSYVEEVSRLKSLDKPDIADGLQFCEEQHEWKNSAGRGC